MASHNRVFTGSTETQYGCRSGMALDGSVRVAVWWEVFAHRRGRFRCQVRRIDITDGGYADRFRLSLVDF
jgi:hypothetical protein